MVPQDEILDTLRHVIDAEVGINIVDLGLVYRLDETDGALMVTMTMTSQSCPLGEHITRQVESLLRTKYPQLKSVKAEITWEPPWIPGMMSEAAKKQMGK